MSTQENNNELSAIELSRSLFQITVGYVHSEINAGISDNLPKNLMLLEEMHHTLTSESLANAPIKKEETPAETAMN